MFLDSLRALTNSLSGLGGARDKAAFGTWNFNALDHAQLECMYRANWMARKAVDIPAFDMLREGWEWEAEDDQVKALEREEKRLGVGRKVLQAKTWARLYGGAAIILGDGSENTETPLRALKKGGLKYLIVATRHQLSSSNLITDLDSPWFGEPEFYTWNRSASAPRLHPSRVVRFIGSPIPQATVRTADEWGDSVLLAIEEAIRDAAATQNGIATLVQEASVDVVKVPQLTEKVSTSALRNRLLERFSLAGMAKSTVNTLLLDAEEDWSQKTANFSQLPDVERLFLQIVSGAADIPATRFLGQSPAGMTATGESDIRNYYDRIASEQENTLRPEMARLMSAVEMSALGTDSEEVDYRFNSLWQLTDKEQAEVAKMDAETATLWINSGLVPDPVMAEGVKATVAERFPAAAGAYEDFGEIEPDEPVDPPLPTEQPQKPPEGDDEQ